MVSNETKIKQKPSFTQYVSSQKPEKKGIEVAANYSNLGSSWSEGSKYSNEKAKSFSEGFKKHKDKSFIEKMKSLVS